MIGRRWLLLFALAAVAAARGDEVDEIVRAEMERQHIPGLALAIVRGGETRLQGYGIANLEHGIPVTPKTVFKIGSVSKQFLAAGVLLLAEEGKLSLDAGLRRYLEDAPDGWADVTIRHALSHTGGLIREGPAFHPFKVQSDLDVIRSAYGAPLVFAPGEKWQYSNVAYFAVGEIIRRVSGVPWEEYLARRIFTPLGMSATRTTTGTRIIPNRAAGYEWQENEYRNAPEFFVVRPSGAFLSTVEDLARWDAALGGEGPLSRKARDLMWTGVNLADGKPSGYGLGWQLGEWAGRRVVHHGGTLAGFKSQFARFPAEKASIIVLTNCGAARPDEIARKVAAAVLAARN